MRVRPGDFIFGDNDGVQLMPREIVDEVLLRVEATFEHENKERELIANQLPALRERYPKLLMSDGIGRALLEPPSSPAECLFSRMSANYSADFKSRVEPCIFGGPPDCSRCGCVLSSGLPLSRYSESAAALPW